MRAVDATGFVFGELDSLPGCSQVVVSHAVYANPEAAPGAGKKAHAERLAYMRKLGWDYALCTVDSSNGKQVSIMKRFLWQCLDSFKSTKTGHIVSIYGRNLISEDSPNTNGSTLLK